MERNTRRFLASGIEFQELKASSRNSGSPYSDEEKVLAVQSVYDAAINANTPDISDLTMPTDVFGAVVTWSSGNTVITVQSGSFIIENDDLTDSNVPGLDGANPLAFEFDGEQFEFDGEEFILRSA